MKEWEKDFANARELLTHKRVEKFTSDMRNLRAVMQNRHDEALAAFKAATHEDKIRRAKQEKKNHDPDVDRAK